METNCKALSPSTDPTFQSDEVRQKLQRDEGTSPIQRPKCMAGWFVGPFVRWLVSRLVVGRLVGRSVCRLVGWSVCWLVGWSVCWLIGWFVSTNCFLSVISKLYSGCWSWLNTRQQTTKTQKHKTIATNSQVFWKSTTYQCRKTTAWRLQQMVRKPQLKPITAITSKQQ